MSNAPTLGDVRLDFDCRDECAEDHVPAPQILVVALGDKGEMSLYDPRCAQDIVKNPELEAYQGVTVYGTHILDDVPLEILFPDDLDVYAPEMWVDDCRATCTGPGPAIIVGVDAGGGFHLLCVGCAQEILDHPGLHDNVGMTLHGTHILSDEILRATFPEDDF